MPICEICVGCQWNHYPECYGTILEDGSYLNIEKGIDVRVFECGVKFRDTPINMSIKPKTLEERIIEIEEKVLILEEKTK